MYEDGHLQMGTEGGCLFPLCMFNAEKAIKKSRGETDPFWDLSQTLQCLMNSHLK